MISGTLRHEGARRSRALRAVPPDVHLVPRRGNGRPRASQATWEREDHLRAQPVQLAGFRAPKGRAVLALDPLSTRRVRLFRRNRQWVRSRLP